MLSNNGRLPTAGIVELFYRKSVLLLSANRSVGGAVVALPVSADDKGFGCKRSERKSNQKQNGHLFYARSSN